jgi:hypothetical protein
MIVPDKYDKKIEHIIDNHTASSLIPNQYVINYLNISKELSEFISSKDPNNINILEIGGRTSPLSFDNRFNVTILETRSRYSTYYKSQSKEIVTDFTHIKKMINNMDVIIIHADYIAEHGYKEPQLYKINQWLSSSQKFYVINYQWEEKSAQSLKINNDGEVYNLYQYKKWFDVIRSHMHLGFNTSNFPSIKVIDLSYDYPINF